MRGSLPSGAVISPRCSCASADPAKLGGVVGWPVLYAEGVGAMGGTSLGEGTMMRGLPSACVAETMLGGCAATEAVETTVEGNGAEERSTERQEQEEKEGAEVSKPIGSLPVRG